VTPRFYPFRNCWRVRVPAAESETGKGVAKYFETEEAAKLFIQQHHRTGSIQLAELSVQERYVLGLIRQSQDYTPNVLLDALARVPSQTENPKVFHDCRALRSFLRPAG
jgi:hypothetical protein